MLKALPDASVQCVVTSPPYFGLRSYLHENDPSKSLEMGSEPSLLAYIAGMVEVFREVRRVLRDDGTVFLNMGDSYYRLPTTNVPQTKNPKAEFLSLPARARRAAACDMAGKEPEDSPDRDCLCRSLCGACRAAYRLGRVHNGQPRAPMPCASTLASNLARTEFQCDHPPTLGFQAQRVRTEGAIPDPPPAEGRAVSRAPAVQASTLGESVGPPLVGCSPMANRGGCRLCGHSLDGCAPVSADRGACICGTAGGASAGRTTDRDVSDSAYQSYTTTSPKPKDLLMVPARLAIALQDDGWWLRSDIIWHKPNPMPESVTDRPTSAHEHVFLLTKSERYFYDAEAIAEPSSPSTHARLSQNVQDQVGSLRANGGAKTNGPMKAVGRKVADAGSGIKNNDSFDAAMAIMPATRNSRNVWTIGTVPYSDAHFATFPPELAERCIKAGTSERGACPACRAPRARDVERTAMAIRRSERTHELGRTRSSGTMLEPPTAVTTGWSPTCSCNAGEPIPCTVLDPFAGAFTTAMVADRLQRDAIGIELNPEYCAMAERRIRKDAGMFADLSA